MGSFVFIIPVFGFLLASSRAGQLRLFGPGGKVNDLLIEIAHFFWQISAIILLYQYGVATWLPIGHQTELAILVVLPLSYLLGLLQKNSEIFYLCTAGVAFEALLSSGGALGQGLFVAFYFSVGILVFEFLFLGLCEKLRLSKLPPIVEGLPSYLILAAILCMVMGVIQGHLT